MVRHLSLEIKQNMRVKWITKQILFYINQSFDLKLKRSDCRKLKVNKFLMALLKMENHYK